MKRRRKQRQRTKTSLKHLTMSSSGDNLAKSGAMISASLDGSRCIAWEPRIAKVSVDEITADPRAFLAALEESDLIFLHRESDKNGAPFAQITPSEGFCKCPLCDESRACVEETATEPLQPVESAANSPSFGTTPNTLLPEPAERWFRLF